MGRVWIVSAWVDTLGRAALTERVLAWARAGQSASVFFATAHMIMVAKDREDFAAVMARADLVCADGRPLHLLQLAAGARDAEHVTGPETMDRVLEACARESLPVAFYGSTESTLETLLRRVTEKYPGLKVALARSPPFRPLSDAEMILEAENLVACGAKVLFVGLGCPKQESWAIAQRARLPMPVLAVGAAFDFHAGHKPMAPAWMRYLALEWLFRLICEPRRLAYRYLVLNPRFLAAVLAQALRLTRMPPSGRAR